MNKNEKISYVELPAKDIQVAKFFFTKAFGWSFIDLECFQFAIHSTLFAIIHISQQSHYAHFATVPHIISSRYCRKVAFHIVQKIVIIHKFRDWKVYV